MSALRDFLELMRGGEDIENIGLPCAATGTPGRFAEPWRSWERNRSSQEVLMSRIAQRHSLLSVGTWS
jgi:hypothetical protein